MQRRLAIGTIAFIQGTTALVLRNAEDAENAKEIIDKVKEKLQVRTFAICRYHAGKGKRFGLSPHLRPLYFQAP